MITMINALARWATWIVWTHCCSNAHYYVITSTENTKWTLHEKKQITLFSVFCFCLFILFIFTACKSLYLKSSLFVCLFVPTAWNFCQVFSFLFYLFIYLFVLVTWFYFCFCFVFCLFLFFVPAFYILWLESKYFLLWYNLMLFGFIIKA